MDELKPCPFCGGKATLFVDSGVRVICTKCFAQSKVQRDSLEYSKPTHAVENVIEAWNRRVGESVEDH